MVIQGIEIKHVREHYEAFKGNQFIVSGDTVKEVIEELNINYNEVI